MFWLVFIVILCLITLNIINKPIKHYLDRYYVDIGVHEINYHEEYSM